MTIVNHLRKKEKEKIDVEAQLKKRQNELLKSEQLKNELSEKVYNI